MAAITVQNYELTAVTTSIAAIKCRICHIIYKIGRVRTDAANREYWRLCLHHNNFSYSLSGFDNVYTGGNTDYSLLCATAREYHGAAHG